MNRVLPGHGLAPPAAAYAHAVVSDGPSRILHTSGVVPIRPDATVPDAIGEQADVVWANLGRLVAEAGMAMTDVVSLTTYVVVGQPLADVMAARDRAIGGHLTASTLVTVPALARPAWKLEIALVAIS